MNMTVLMIISSLLFYIAGIATTMAIVLYCEDETVEEIPPSPPRPHAYNRLKDNR